MEAYIDVRLQPGTTAQGFEAAVMKLPGVVSMAILTGSFDVRLRVASKDQADLVRLIETLRARTGAMARMGFTNGLKFLKCQPNF